MADNRRGGLYPPPFITGEEELPASNSQGWGVDAPALPFALIHRSAWRDCPKSLGDALSVALLSAEKDLFGLFRPPHNVRIHLRSVAQTLLGQSRKVNSQKFGTDLACRK